jgi:hypothetical protein
MSPQGPDFPSYVPSSRSLAMGDFPSKTFTSQSGIQATVQYGSRRTNQTIDLAYNNTTEAIAAAIYDHYVACRGTIYTFALTEPAKSGNPTFHLGDSSASTSNRYSAAPFGMKYKYAEAPQFSSIKPGRMSVTVKLVGVLDA